MAASPFRRTADALRAVLPGALWDAVRGLGTALATPLRFSTRTGHFRSSLAARAVAADGTPLPWYTYPAIDFLAARDYADRQVLEFGGGQSTLWWQARARGVVTFESHYGWEARLARMRAPDLELHHMPVELPDEACLAEIVRLLGGRTFDVIVLDGHLRRELVAIAFDHLAPNGAILLDDAEGFEVQGELEQRDCRRIDFMGFAPGVARQHCTSLVYVGDCFLLKPDIAIPSPAALA
ncbi:MAG: hypothetical protein JSR47_24135 [Proteobacteria bacterium]|nr:hypothetical protein [Pseudomonadota bacterium]